MTAIRYRVTEKLAFDDTLLQRRRAHHFEARTLGITPSYSVGAADEAPVVEGMEHWIRTEKNATPERVLPNLIDKGG